MAGTASTRREVMDMVFLSVGAARSADTWKTTPHPARGDIRGPDRVDDRMP